MSTAATFVSLPISDPGHDAALKDLKVAELRAVCELLGLSSKGRKGELADRVREAKAAPAGLVPGPTPTTQAELLVAEPRRAPGGLRG